MDTIKELDINSILQWNENKQINPISGRKIKENGIKYNNFKKLYKKYFPNDYNFFDGNQRDPVSLVDIWVTENNVKKFVYKDFDNLILYKDDNNLINCFEKDTINYFIEYKIEKHPVTFSKIPKHIFEMINYKKKVVKKTIKDRAFDIFQKFTEISVFIDSAEFLLLSDKDLNKLYYETHDFFHNNLPESTIKKIKDVGEKNNVNSFIVDLESFNKLNFEEKQKNILESFETLLCYKDESVKCMSYYIILGGLSLFIPKIKEAYPDFCFNF